MEVAERPNGESILIVEDDVAIRANVRDCVQHLGYTALEASSGAAALRLCEQLHGNVDLVMTDLVMPGMSGLELAQQLTQRFPAVALLFTSGYSEDGVARRGLLRDATVFRGETVHRCRSGTRGAARAGRTARARCADLGCGVRPGRAISRLSQLGEIPSACLTTASVLAE